MSWQDYSLPALYLALVLGFAPPLGRWMARVFRGEHHALRPALGWLERLIYRLGGLRPDEEMTWRRYAFALVAFNVVGFVFLLGLELFQARLPLNPGRHPAVSWALALNTASSFVTNTNWQNYAGEATMSRLTQMLGLGVQNFLSAATGIAVLLALIRGLARRSAGTLGNFWADLVRATVYVLLPLACLLGVLLVWQGVPQTLAPSAHATTLEGVRQVIPVGPVASQVAIKQLGSNGGGYYGANSAHPFENPTPLSNFLEMLAILLLPAALCHTYGELVGSRRHGWVLLGAMTFIFVGGLTVALWAEHAPNPVFGGAVPLEGKEVRFGITNSVLWATATTATSNGSVNCMHDSLSPLAGGVALLNMLLGEVVFGGVGTGLYTMAAHVILAVFLAGLMVGRTPEYLGKKIEAFEVRMSVLAVLVPSSVVLTFSALACATPAGRAGPLNAGPHGFIEILYAFASMANNNGSAFAGLNGNTTFYNLLGVAALFLGRYVVILPVLAIAGRLAAKKVVPPSAGTFPTDGPLFGALLVGVVLLVGALTFFPALALGPVLERGLMLAGRTF